MTQTKITIPAELNNGKIVNISKIWITRDGFAIAVNAETGEIVHPNKENAKALAETYGFEKEVEIDIDTHIKLGVKNEQPKEKVAEDYAVYAINPNGKKVYFKMSKITSKKCSSKAEAKRILEGNDYKVQKILTEDEDRAWEEFMNLDYNVSSSTLWRYFRKSYKTGFCRRWTGKEWVEGWM